MTRTLLQVSWLWEVVLAKSRQSSLVCVVSFKHPLGQVLHPAADGATDSRSNCLLHRVEVVADSIIAEACAHAIVWAFLLCEVFRVRKISPKFSCIKFFQIRDIPTQIPGHPGHSLSKTTEKGHLHKVFVRDIPTSGSRMSQEYPTQKLYV